MMKNVTSKFYWLKVETAEDGATVVSTRKVMGSGDWTQFGYKRVRLETLKRLYPEHAAKYAESPNTLSISTW